MAKKRKAHHKTQLGFGLPVKRDEASDGSKPPPPLEADKPPPPAKRPPPPKVNKSLPGLGKKKLPSLGKKPAALPRPNKKLQLDKLGKAPVSSVKPAEEDDDGWDLGGEDDLFAEESVLKDDDAEAVVGFIDGLTDAVVTAPKEEPEPESDEPPSELAAALVDETSGDFDEDDEDETVVRVDLQAELNRAAKKAKAEPKKEKPKKAEPKTTEPKEEVEAEPKDEAKDEAEPAAAAVPSAPSSPGAPSSPSALGSDAGATEAELGEGLFEAIEEVLATDDAIKDKRSGKFESLDIPGATLREAIASEPSVDEPVVLPQSDGVPMSWIIGGVAALVIGGGIAFFVMSGDPPAETSAPTTSATPTTTTAAAVPTQTSAASASATASATASASASASASAAASATATAKAPKPVPKPGKGKSGKGWWTKDDIYE